MKKYRVVAIIIIMSMCFMAACNSHEEKINQDENRSEKSEIYKYVEQYYGFADDIIYGSYTAKMTHENNQMNAKDETSLKKNSKGGAVFYKDISGVDSSYSSEYICVYLSDNQENVDKIVLRLDDIKIDKSNNSTTTKQITIGEPHMKNRCYCIIKDNYLICVEKAEKNEGIYNGRLYLSYKDQRQTDNLEYEETVSVYNLKKECNKVFSITRKIMPELQKETKECYLEKGEEKFLYAAGFGKYSSESSIFLSTEKEFCDKVNEELENIGIKNISFTRTSWKNRWYRLEVNEDSIPEQMVKVDFKSENIVDTESLVKDDIEITVNEKEEKKLKLEDEGADNPINYNQEENEKNQVVMPKSIPKGIDISQLQDLRYFDIDGFWYTKDKEYVFHIHTKTGGAFSQLQYAEPIKSSGGHIGFGKVSQQSTYSIKLTTTDRKDIISSELVAVTGKLKSDKITLYKADVSLVNSIKGTWMRGDKKITFDDDGTYHFYSDNDSYWGYYFIIDESSIVLGKRSDNLSVQKYSIDEKKLTICDRYEYVRE